VNSHGAVAFRGGPVSTVVAGSHGRVGGNLNLTHLASET
jgi:hypothetical protein